MTYAKTTFKWFCLIVVGPSIYLAITYALGLYLFAPSDSLLQILLSGCAVLTTGALVGGILVSLAYATGAVAHNTILRLRKRYHQSALQLDVENVV